MTLVHLTLLPLVLVATVSGLREQELQCEPIKIEQVTSQHIISNNTNVEPLIAVRHRVQQHGHAEHDGAPAAGGRQGGAGDLPAPDPVRLQVTNQNTLADHVTIILISDWLQPRAPVLPLQRPRADVRAAARGARAGPRTHPHR